MNRLNTFIADLKRLISGYVEREVIEVDEWDGAASNYSSTEAYCNACLINLNEGDAADWTQELCKLPVRREGDGSGTYVDKAVIAAAGGRGITQVKKPDGVDDSKWESAVKKAANEIINAYEEMEMMAPESVYEVAEKEKPDTEERALSYERVWTALWDILDREQDVTGTPLYPLDIFLDEGQSFALLAMNGKLFRADLTVTGDEVTMQTPYRVRQEFLPVGGEERSKATIYRQKDGRTRVTVIAATAVLNRVRAIDSRALFDSFAAHVARTGEYPIINFAHQGGGSRLGEADYIARDENVYIVSYLFDDNEYGKAAARTVSENPEEWGHSIEFFPMQPPEIIELSGMKIPVYIDGINRRISILKENKAAHWFTNVKEIERMNEKIFNDLEDLMGKDLAVQFAEQVDGVNREVVEEDLIVRETPEPVEEESLNAFRGIVREEIQTAMSNLTFTPDEAFTAEIARRVTDGDAFKTLNDAVTELRQAVQANQEAHDITRRSVTQLSARLNAVEQPVNDMLEQRQAAMPYQGGFNVTVSRPSEVRRATTVDNIEIPPSSEDLVQNGLGKLPSYRVPGGK